MLKIFFEVMIHELSKIFRFREVFAVLIIGIVTYFFFYPLPYNNEEVRDVPIAVMDQDNTTMSRDLLRMIDASDSLKITEHIENLGEGKELLKARDVYGILVIPFNFEQNILQGHKEAAIFYGDASYVMIYSAASTAISTIVQKKNQTILVNKQIQMGVDPSVAQGNSAPYQPVMVQVFNPQTGYATYVIPPAFTLILHQSIWLGVMLACVLSRNSLFDFQLTKSTNLSTARLSFVVVLAKYAAYLFYGAFVFWIIALFLPYWYDLPRLGEISDLAVLGFFFVSAIIFLALAMSYLFKTMDTVFLLMLPFSMIFFFLAGMSWPVYLMPEILNIIADFFPSTSGIDGLVRVNQMGASLEHVIPVLMNLATLIVIYGLAAYYMTYRYLNRVKDLKEAPQQ